MRIALETGTRFGTSGTYAWLPIRFALVTPTERLCITDEAALARAYQISARHNCGDVLEISDNDRRYQIRAPDTRTSAPARTIATLSIYQSAALVHGPSALPTARCATAVPGAPCISGGPCD